MNNVIEKIDEINAIDRVQTFLRDLQKRICTALEKEEGLKQFQEDAWQHASGGGGLTRVLEAGKHIEKGGVNFSHVYGSELPQAATQKRPQLANIQFQATGLSLVIHPQNPFVPTTHANIRFIVVKEGIDKPAFWWFGGGFDLTPYYGFHEDCVHWHKQAKAACDPFGESLYPRLKKWCDDYFYLKHRQEPRGIGGIFFDDLNNLTGNEWDFEKCFGFLQNVGNRFIDAYLPIFSRRKDLPFTESERQFQAYRRGRYVEFNLLYDRGTLFGLQSGGRTESILMSLPPEVQWRYNWQPEKGSREEQLYEEFLKPREWV